MVIRNWTTFVWACYAHSELNVKGFYKLTGTTPMNINHWKRPTYGNTADPKIENAEKFMQALGLDWIDYLSYLEDGQLKLRPIGKHTSVTPWGEFLVSYKNDKGWSINKFCKEAKIVKSSFITWTTTTRMRSYPRLTTFLAVLERLNIDVKEYLDFKYMYMDIGFTCDTFINQYRNHHKEVLQLCSDTTSRT